MSTQVMHARILMVISAYHPIIGGAERQAKKIAEGLVKTGCQVDVLTMRKNGLMHCEIINGVNVIRTGFLKRKILQYSSMFGMYRFILRNHSNYDVVHIHQGLLASFAATLAAKKTGLPSIIKIGNSGYKFDLDLLRKKYWLGSWFVKSVIQNCTKFIAITPQIKDEMLKYGIEEDRIEYVPNGVKIPKVIAKLEKRQQLGFVDDEVIGVCVGRLMETKNHAFLLNLFASSNLENVKILLLGEGPLQSEINSIISDLDLLGKVELKGNVDNIEDYLQAADFFILPSKTEGLSNALIEAMVYQLPVLVSDIPGNRHVIGENNDSGFLCSLSKTQDWSRCLLEIVRDEKLRFKIGRSAKNRVEDKFSLSTIITKYLILYDKLISKK
jgi:glycosyltransferase involved in cell wall biosynthesis